MIYLNTCHNGKVSAAQCTGITINGIPQLYRGDSEGCWGSGTRHMGLGVCQGGRACTSGHHGMLLCFKEVSTRGTDIPMQKAGSVTSGNVFVCLLGFHRLLVLWSHWLSGALHPLTYLQTVIEFV